MLSLKKRIEFWALSRWGEKFTCPYFTMRWIPRDRLPSLLGDGLWVKYALFLDIGLRHRPTDCGLLRLGLTVTKKTAPRAVDRNRIRRRLRAFFWDHCDATRPLDVVLVGYRGVLECSVAQLKAAITEGLGAAACGKR